MRDNRFLKFVLYIIIISQVFSLHSPLISLATSDALNSQEITYSPGTLSADNSNVVIPAVSRVIYETSFDDKDSHIVKKSGNGEVFCNDGSLVMVRNDSAAVNFDDETRIYLSSDCKGDLAKVAVAEFVVSRDVLKLLDFGFFDDEDMRLGNVSFLHTGEIACAYRETEDSKALDHMCSGETHANTDTTVTVMFNHISSAFSVWVNGTLVLNQKYCENASDNLAYMSVRMCGENTQTVSLRSFKAYEGAMNSSDKVEMDMILMPFSALSTEPQNAVTSKLSLPAVGANGSTITWSVSGDTEAMSPNGTVTRSELSDKNVTLTATVTNGGVTKTKDYNITIKKFSVHPLPSVMNVIVEDSMTGSGLSGLVTDKKGNLTPTNKGILLESGAGFAYRFSKQSTAYYQPMVYEFKLDGDGTCIEFIDSSEDVCYMIETKDNALYAVARSNKTSEPAKVHLKDGLISDNLFKVMIDPMSGMFAMWYGDDKVLMPKFGMCDASRVYKVRFSQQSGEAYISNYRAYIANVPAKDALIFDSSAISFERISWQDSTSVTDNLSLPQSGNAGSIIKWSSGNESVVDSAGQVTTPVSGSENVILTATVSHGSDLLAGEISVPISFTVVSAQKDELPGLRETVVEDKFINNGTLSQWTLNSADGYISVKNEKLLLKRFSNEISGDSGTFASLNFDGAGSNLTGLYFLEFTVRKNNTAQLFIRVRDSSANDLFAANWSGDSIYPYNGENTTRIPVPQLAKFKILMNTSSGTYSLWINDELKIENAKKRFEECVGLGYLRFYANGTSYVDLEVDNVRLYSAYGMPSDRVAMDKEVLHQSSLISSDDPAINYGGISRNLNLPNIGEYGSAISWSSDDESVVLSDGTVIPGAKSDSVTLTATISYGDCIDTKSFTFRVISSQGTASDDVELLTYDVVARDDGGSDRIKRPLNFVTEGIYGSSITWSTSNPEVITPTGRVIRPRFNEEDAAVTVTATIANGGLTFTKRFDFVVVADEEFVDPQHMSDAEFFGVWNGSRWTTEPKWNYDYSGMEAVGEAAKAANGDYTKAKEELLKYFRDVRPSYSRINSSTRNTMWANMVADDFYHPYYSSYYNGGGYIGPEWSAYSLDIKPTTLTDLASVSYCVRAWYNESSYAQIVRHTAANPTMRPRLVVTVGGTVKTLEAVDSVEVRAGNYMNVNYGDEEYMNIRTFGDFMGDDTSYAKLRFDLSEIMDSGTVTDVKLVLYAKASPGFGGEKRMIVAREANTSWSGETSTWNSFTGTIYSFNGIPEKNHWNKIDGADFEYLWQICRFYAFPAIAVEYQATGDDNYIYKAQRIIEDYITDTGGRLSAGNTWSEKDAEQDGAMRGGFPRTLDIAEGKLLMWNDAMHILFDSPYATPDFCTAMLKNMWDSYNYLTVYRTSAGNWLQYELQGLFDGSLRMPEFADSKSWYDFTTVELNKLLFSNTVADGSYVEATGEYSSAAFSGFADYKAQLVSRGEDVSSDYDELLHKSAYYNLALYSPHGQGLNYGDSGESSRSSGGIYSTVADWYDDDELNFIATFGEKGVEPEWTSIHFPHSTVTAMRANWSKGSPFLFTNVRGGGQHGHRDYNGVVVSAYNRILLVDSGIFNYDETDELRMYGTSTEAHNTVMINDSNQEKGGGSVSGFESVNNEVYEFSTNNAFDFLSQSTFATSGYDHQRSITFIKPNVWIISDRVIPDDKSESNNYKQLWHMRDNAGLETVENDNVIRSNWSSGANVILASATDGAMLKEQDAYYSKGYGYSAPAKYAYYELSGKSGVASFDTVIAVNDGDSTASLTAEPLSTSSINPDSDPLGQEGGATAIKFNITSHGEDYVGYYRLSYDGGSGTFGPYETDAKLAFIEERADDGSVVSVVIKDGTYIKRTDGTIIFESASTVSEVCVDMTGANTYITANNANTEGFTIYCSYEPVKLYVNEEIKDFSVNGNYISGIKEESENADTGSVPNAGINKDEIQGPTSGGNAGGGGGSTVGGGTSTGGTVVSPGVQTPFADINGHWAKDYILDLYNHSIVNGDTNGNFNPDNPITRAEFTAMIVRSLKLNPSDYNGEFSDVSESDWYAQSVQTALDNGLISKDITFRPNDLITRQEMAKIISEAVNLKDKFPSADDCISAYADKSDISSWATSYVGSVTAANLMSGRDGGRFCPLDNAARAEAATVISRMLKYINK